MEPTSIPQEGAIQTFITALASKPELLVLVAVLAGIGFVLYKLAMKWLDIYQAHGENLIEEVKSVGESLKSMDSKMERLSEKLEDLAERVSGHDRRIEKLEDK